MDGFFIGQIASLGDLDRIDFADQIGDGDIRCRQLLAVTAVAIDPLERQGVTQVIGRLATSAANRLIRIIVDLASLDDGNALVEQTNQAANNPRFALIADRYR